MSPTSAAIRRSLSHPVIDIDGHIAEYFPALAPYLEQEGLALDHPALARLLPAYLGPDHDVARDGRRRAGADARRPRPVVERAGPEHDRPRHRAVPGPAVRTARRARPRLQRRVPEPRVSCSCTPGRTTRARGACRALNRCNAETFAPFADRLAPGRRDPDAHAGRSRRRARVRGEGARVQVGAVRRLRAAADRRRRGDRSALARWATWLDQFGLDSAYDYDPVWANRPGARRVDRVPLGFHRAQPAPVDLELHVQPPRLARRGPALARQVVVPRRRDASLPGHELRVPRRRRRVGRRRSTATSSATGRSATSKPCAPQLDPALVDRDAHARVHRGSTRPTRPGAIAAPTARARRHARRVGRVRHRAGRRHQDLVRRSLLLRLRSRRPADDARRSTPRSTRSAPASTR